MIRTLLLGVLIATGTALQSRASTIAFDFALVGNAGNEADPETGFGSVAYNYAISTTEVTNAQYAHFLNAVAAIDNFGGVDPNLYNANMGSTRRGGIVRSGTPGAYTYATKANMSDKPVNYVSFIDAMRFTNWLHNGQGEGGTEAGVYLVGNGLTDVRSDVARFWIPSDDEWYKAAYHDASAGTTGSYFNYATGEDRPTVASANSVGDISNPGAGIANFNWGAYWNGRDGNVTTVGSAGIDSASPYGTFDQDGNVWEWSEAIFASYHVTRGGSWGWPSAVSSRASRLGAAPTFEQHDVGFRVATVPEPSSWLLAVVAGMGLVRQTRRLQCYRPSR